ncbi:Cytochrome P450 [Operophtera brumata]|uniref:Cytochrome P450 n=1 Tax=Operophtera brumata TaxID=104452 RepID=A0A0L7KWM4_OPEBR|nr:Cytochrome P450 [Operophtera brumata]
MTQFWVSEVDSMRRDTRMQRWHPFGTTSFIYLEQSISVAVLSIGYLAKFMKKVASLGQNSMSQFGQKWLNFFGTKIPDLYRTALTDKYINVFIRTESTLGVKVNSQLQPTQPFLKAFETILKIDAARICQPWLHNNTLFKMTPTYKVHSDNRTTICGFIDRPKTFLELLIESTGGERGYSDLELQEETLVLVPVTVEDLPRLKYLDAVIRETLRLYPSVPIIVRKVTKDLTLPSGITFVKDCGMLINIWAIHRNPKYWGYQYAMMSMKTAVSTLVRRYRLHNTADLKQANAPLRVKFDVMMKHVDNFELQLEARQ